MTKLIKDLFKNEKALGKFFAIITMIALAFTLVTPGAFAAFWRTLAGSTDPYSTTLTSPNDSLYGWGYGSALEWGYGYGYGYGVNNNAGYYANQAGDPLPGVVDTPPSPGGGGGGGSYSAPSDSSTVTSIIASTISKVIDRIRTISRPMQILAGYLEASGKGFKAKLTNSKGIITLKPNKDSILWAVIPSDTWVTSAGDWDGKIMPPLIRSKTIISKKGEEIKGASKKFKREDADVVIKIGSYHTELEFNNPIAMVVPVELDAGTPVAILYSPDGDKWESIGQAKVKNGKVSFESKHFSYFAVSAGLAGESGMSGSQIEATVQTTTGVFRDITNHWARNYIQNIADLGIVSGKTSTRFAPNDNITRAELTKIALKAFGYSVSPRVSSTMFKDVDSGKWYAPYIVAARNAGVIQGYGDGVFSPNGAVNRAEALKILIEAGGFNGVDSNYENNYASRAGWTYAFFPDVKIGAWFAKYVAYAKDFGIVGGYSDGNFRPSNSITRAEVAKIVTKLLEM